MAEESAGLSIREALVNAVQEHTAEGVDGDNAVPESLDGIRARDEAGKFTTKTEVAATAVTDPTETVIEPVRPAKPSSWKKELDEHWQKADPKLAEYIVQREREYATGVSTYKQEAERSRHIQQALEPFMPDLQRHNIDPGQWIQNLGNAHQTLVKGSPQQKVAMFTQLANDYGIDLGQLTQLSPEQLQAMRQPQQPAFDPRMIDQRVMGILEQQNAKNVIDTIKADKVNYPHFDEVRETMAGLLQSGLAQDLKSAYTKAIRMNDDLFTAQQAEQQRQSDAERQAKQVEAATKARAKVVSVKSSTPSGQATTSAAKGRREQIAEAAASLSSGRV